MDDIRERLHNASPLRKTGKLFGLVFLCVGVFFTAMSIYFFTLAASKYKSEEEFRAQAVAVDAHVVSVQQKPGAKEGEVVFVPEVVFQDADGAEHTATLAPAKDAETYRKGTPVHMLYPAGNPDAAREDSFREFYLLPVLLTALGGTVFLMALLFLGSYALLRRQRAKVAK